MHIRPKTIFFVYAALSLALVMPARSAEPLSFYPPQSMSFAGNLPKITQESFENMVLAAADLNGDGVDELLTRNADCPENRSALCRFEIHATDADAGLISLGTIEAHGLAIANHAAQGGVRDIIAYDNVKNTYSYSLYVWNGGTSRYERLSEKGDTQ